MLNKLWKDIYHYWISLSWILKDLFSYFRWTWLAASLFTLASPTLQAMSFALLTSFVVFTVKGTVIRGKYFSLAFLDPSDFSSVLFIALLCSGLLLCAALTKYLGDNFFIDLRFKYTRFSIDRGFNYISRYMFCQEHIDTKIFSKLISLIRRDSIACGRIATLAASAISPFIEFVIFGTVTLYFYPLLTITLVVLIALNLRFFYKIIAKGSYYSLLREKQAFFSSEELRISLQEKHYLNDSSDRNYSADIFMMRFPDTEEWINSLSQYILVVPKSRLAASILISLMVGIIILFLGTYNMIGTSQLDKSLIYLIILRYVFRAFQDFVSRFSAFNRFYSQALRYKEIISGNIPKDIFDSLDIDEED